MKDLNELVLLAQTGDSDALGELYTHCFKYAVTVLGRVLRNYPNDVEDVASVASTQAVLKIGQFQNESRFSTWFHRIVLNEAWMVLRTKKRRPLDLADTLDTESGGVVKSICQPDPGYAHFEVRKDLETILSKVTKDRRTILRIRFLEGLSNEESVLRVGKSMSAVKSIQHRAILMAREAAKA